MNVLVVIWTGSVSGADVKFCGCMFRMRFMDADNILVQAKSWDKREQAEQFLSSVVFNMTGSGRGPSSPRRNVLTRHKKFVALQPALVAAEDPRTVYAWQQLLGRTSLPVICDNSHCGTLLFLGT